MSKLSAASPSPVSRHFPKLIFPYVRAKRWWRLSSEKAETTKILHPTDLTRIGVSAFAHAHAFALKILDAARWLVLSVPAG